MRHVLTLLLILWLLLPSFGLAQELSCPKLPNVENTVDVNKSIVEICLATDKAIGI